MENADKDLNNDLRAFTENNYPSFIPLNELVIDLTNSRLEFAEMKANLNSAQKSLELNDDPSMKIMIEEKIKELEDLSRMQEMLISLKSDNLRSEAAKLRDEIDKELLAKWQFDLSEMLKKKRMEQEDK
ncbi:MAG: hypothetical protein WC761_03820 [Candidatus Paceibacterota bacterium]